MDSSRIIEYSPICELVRRIRRWVEAADIDLNDVEPEDRAEYEDYKNHCIRHAVLDDWKAMNCVAPVDGIYSRMKVATWLVSDYIGRVITEDDLRIYEFLYGSEPPSAEQMIDFWTDYYKASR